MIEELKQKLDYAVITGVPIRKDMLLEASTVYLIGNGGSAAVCSHICADMVKQGINARTLFDPAVLTMCANDYGWETSWQRQMKRAGRGDLLIAISSSGNSKNIVYAALEARNAGLSVTTLTGFSADNNLRTCGHGNYWCDSKNYGVVEICHLAWLHDIVNPG